MPPFPKGHQKQVELRVCQGAGCFSLACGPWCSMSFRHGSASVLIKPCVGGKRQRLKQGKGGPSAIASGKEAAKCTWPQELEGQDNGLSICGDQQVRIGQQTSRLPSNLGQGTSNSWLLLCFLPPYSTQVFPPALPTSEAWSVLHFIRHFSDKHYLHNNKSADLIRSSSDREQITATNAFRK